MTSSARSPLAPCAAERAWPPEIVNRLSLIAQVFANALARKRADLELRRALEENARLRDQLVEENVYLQHEVKALHGASPITGQSAAIRSVLSQVDQVAPTAATVLLLGETGTGKELLATAIHDRSPRSGRADGARQLRAPFRRRCSRASCSAARRARTPARSRARSDASSWPTARRSSSTRSAS